MEVDMDADDNEQMLLKRAEKMAPDDGFVTESSKVQREVEMILLSKDNDECAAGEQVEFSRERAQAYLLAAVQQPIASFFVVLDASQPWLCYWILHALDILSLTEDCCVEEHVAKKTVEYLKTCSHSSGGYGGGPGQLAHLATTYAAVSALSVLGTKEALESIDRVALHSFLLRMKQPGGGFTVTANGEMDVRGMYCALAVASLTNILTDDLIDGCADFIKKLQAFDGGMGGEEGNEAHGGYTYCALASLAILCNRDTDVMGEIVDLDEVAHWSAMRQMSLEGGFQGRTNKLVDSCYSFWIGALFSLLRKDDNPLLFDGKELERYISKYCQAPKGGMRDKPGKGADYYHTCYALSGLSLAYQSVMERGEEIPRHKRLKRIDPVHNLTIDRFNVAHKFFYDQPSIKDVAGD